MAIIHEYEFRLVVRDSSPFISFFKNLGLSSTLKRVIYVKPHFRFKNGVWETKRIESIHSVYHDDLWFKWVHSVETPYRFWSRSLCNTFLHNVGNFQDPFIKEIRHFVRIDSNAQLYFFQSGDCDYKLVFEWEYGTFNKPLENFIDLSDSLNKYKYIYDAMKCYSPSSYRLNEDFVRKPVTCVKKIESGIERYLYAHKLDGVFGLVFSYGDKIKEKWEGYECVIRRNRTLGNGFAFAAEKIKDGRVFLLDVYQVRGHTTASWCRRNILLDFLPKVKLIENYRLQTYVVDKNDLPPPSCKIDGLIIHDIERDVVYKYKPNFSVDLVYFKKYFRLPNGRRIKCLDENLEDGCVYEISTSDGRVVRKRFDRFKGNTMAQIENVFSGDGWHGPPIH